MNGPPPDRFHEVDALFDAALDIPAHERGAFVDRACAGDAELRGAVLRLLRAHRHSGGFLEAPAVELAAPLLIDAAPGAADPAPPPERVGAYRIVRELGHGGMGTVFLAERDDGQFRQRVALKLIRHAAGASGLVPRFLEERRILALLEHPHIARLLDGGVTAAGLPYFAMELVDGEPIDRYCDARALPVDRRLALFGRVCEAVQYAHQHLVVHRDLKPSNILVTADGQLKLLDFGIAKLLDPLAPADDAPLTRTGAHLMTPEYAAPEQLRGDPVSTATDVYALGVLLYLLLTGRRPHDLRGRSPAAVERIVGDVEPARPSAAFDDGGPGSEPRARARARGSTPDRLRRRLRGDLDAIVMTALRKEPARRYQSAAALLDDLHRVRDGRPVLARADGAGYRLRKFVGRQRAGVTVAASLALLLAGAGVRERTLRGRAEAEAQKARAVQAFMVGVFDVSDPFAPPDRRPEEVTARALLDRGASRIDSSLAGQPAAQAELRGALGRVYATLSLYAKAEPLLVRSLAQRRALYGPRHPAVAEAMDQLGELLVRTNQFDRAEPLLRGALAQRRALLGSRDAATAASLDHLATLLQERSDYDAAEPLFREALATRRALLGSDHPDVALSINNLALLLWHKGAYDEAARLQHEVVAIDERRLGRDHPLTAAAVHNLAQFQQFRGRFAEAESLYRVALAAKRKSLGSAHPSVTVNLDNLAALLYRETDRFDEAEALAREALALDRQIFGARHGYVAASLGHVAAALTGKGALDEAERLQRESLAMSRSLFGAEHTAVARALNGVAIVRQLRGDLDGAIPLFREARAQYRHLHGERHPSYTLLTVNLARALRERGDVAEAERLFREALGALDPTKPPQYVQLIAARVGLGRALTARGRAGEALPLLERALEMSRERHGVAHWRTAEARLALGECLSAAGRPARAVPLLREAHDALRRHARAQPRLAAEAAAALAASGAGGREAELEAVMHLERFSGALAGYGLYGRPARRPPLAGAAWLLRRGPRGSGRGAGRGPLPNEAAREPSNRPAAKIMTMPRRGALGVVPLALCALAAACRRPAVAPLVVPGESAVMLTGGPNASMTYAARTSAGLVLIDLGWWGHGRALRRALRTLGASPGDVAAVFLTHAHRDHLAAWRSVRRATFYAAAPEYPRLTGAERPRGWIPRWAERLKPARLPRAGELAVVTFSRDTTFVLGADTLRAYHVPGHTPGSAVYLFRGTLFLGDAVTYRRAGGFAPARRGFSDDSRLAAASLARLWARLPPGAVRYACTAHAFCARFTPAFLADVAR